MFFSFYIIFSVLLRLLIFRLQQLFLFLFFIHLFHHFVSIHDIFFINVVFLVPQYLLINKVLFFLRYNNILFIIFIRWNHHNRCNGFIMFLAELFCFFFEKLSCNSCFFGHAISYLFAFFNSFFYKIIFNLFLIINGLFAKTSVPCQLHLFL